MRGEGREEEGLGGWGRGKRSIQIHGEKAAGDIVYAAIDLGGVERRCVCVCGGGVRETLCAVGGRPDTAALD